MVTFSVWGMINTEKVSRSTLFTVSETPSSATDPLAAMKRASSAGRAQPQLGHVDEIVARYQFGDAIDMAAHHMAAELVAEAERAFEIEPGAARPGAGGGHPQCLGRGVHGKRRSVTGPSTAHNRQADA